MAERAAEALTSRCERCGSAYRAPHWGREYLCPACGRPLSERAPAIRFRLPNWLLPSLCALALAVTLVRFAQLRMQQRLSARQVAAYVPDRVELPPHFDARLREKIRLLDEELETSSRQPVLLARLAECCLYLAVLHKDEPRSKAHWRGRAKAYATALRQVSPELAAQLEIDINDPDRLAWTGGGSSTLATSAWSPRSFGGGPGNGFNSGMGGSMAARSFGGAMGAMPMRPSVGAGPGSFGGGFGPGFGGGFSAGGPPPGASTFPRPRPLGGVAGILPDTPGPGRSRAIGVAPSGDVAGGVPAAPRLAPAEAGPALPRGESGPPPSPWAMAGRPAGSPPGGGPDPDGPHRWDPERQRSDAAIRELQRQWEENPEDYSALDNLIGEITQRGEFEMRRHLPDREAAEKAREVYLERAARVYEHSVPKAHLRVHQAAWLRAAASLYGRVKDYDKQYALLQEASRLAPYAVDVWRDLQSVCLRTMRYKECTEARRMVIEWSFPGLRPRP